MPLSQKKLAVLQSIDVTPGPLRAIVQAAGAPVLPHIYGLIDERLVEECEACDVGVTPSATWERYFRLTETGRKVLEERRAS